MANVAKMFAGHFNFSIGKVSFPVPYIQAIVVVVLIFFLVLLIAQFRRHYVNWSFKGALFGIIFGFLLALILEGFLLIGGKTILTSVLGWKNPPAPISIALDAGKNKLMQVLGASTQISSTLTSGGSTVTGAVQFLQNLNPGDISKVKAIICQ
jgi:hypothetical protein